MNKTLAKVKGLEQFVRKHGDDVLISQTLSKMLQYRVRQYEKEIKKLDGELKRFEQSHLKKSSDFFKEFSEGLLGDEMDFVEWASLYQMRQHLLEKKAELESL